ncbi:hypothetical protein SAMN04487898_12221 [Pedobacter sp. ok626]|uniref:hypothetical protein n=1 Tax=Pedobacter sp. ok626 TaxID=1761882 RepID=UPI00087F460B|nr:hypothetical protein [Pedobacter sp. ok626]SDL64876.1 hypothetical protein SAMN04487898_12221 [Pedobacter sp. ok626]
MHQILLTLHSANRWLVLIFLIYAIFLSARGILRSRAFGKHDNFIRHFTATISHVQLMLGLGLYLISPTVKFNSAIAETHLWIDEHNFFRYVHISLMIISVILITIGSARARRMQTDGEKFKTMLLWFSLALFVIFIAIPWPFSPVANRPFFRSF